MSNLRSMTRCRRLGPLLLGATVLLGACGGDDDASGVTVPADEATTTTATTDPSTTTDPDAEAKEAVEQAYYDQWDAYIEILSDPDPTNPLIEQHFTGAIREKLLDTISSFVRDGHAARRPPKPGDFQPAVEAIRVEPDNDSAELIECIIDGIQIIERASGAVINDAVSVLRVRNVFIREGDGWKLADSEVVERLEGRGECDASDSASG